MPRPSSQFAPDVGHHLARARVSGKLSRSTSSTGDAVAAHGRDGIGEFVDGRAR